MPRHAALIAAALSLATVACTHQHQLATAGPLPANTVDHGRGALEGGTLGLLAGGVAGAAAGLIEGDDEPCADEELFCYAWSAKEKAVLLGLVGAGVGSLSGLVLGAAIGSRDVYERAPGWAPKVSASAGPGAARATATWSF